MKHTKIICTSFILLLFLIILFLPNFVFADDSSPSYFISDYYVHAYINEDGSMHIDEKFSYVFSSSANGLTRDLRYFYQTNNKDTMEPESPRYQASGIKNLTVSVEKSYGDSNIYKEVNSAKNGDSGVYTIEEINTKKEKGYNIKVYSPVTSDSSQMVTYSYDVEDIAVQYNDMCEIYYNFIGNGVEEEIKHFQLEINLPDGSNINESKYFPHTYATKLENIITKTYESSNSITLSVNDEIPSYTPFDIRIVFPNNNVMNCTKNYNANYDFTTLDKIEDKMSNGNNRYYLHININITIATMAVVLFIVFVIYSSIKTKKYKLSVKKATYYRDIPNKLNLLQYKLLLPGKSTDALNSNLIIATILDLVNKKALNMETLSNPKRKGKVKFDYNLSLIKDFDYTTLQPYENQILSMLFTDNITTRFDFNQYMDKAIELNDRFKEISKNRKLINQITNARRNKLINVEDMYKQLPSKTIKFVFITMVILILFLTINILFINPSSNDKFAEMFIGLMAILLSYCVLISIVNDKYKAVKDEYNKEAKELYGLFKYLQDYSLIKDRYPLEVNLWNKYLVFASLFGIADKVSKEFKEELINKGYTDDQIYLTYPVLCISTYSNSFANSINSSTGYSGSGSGGGGGRRRGSRCFLTPN